MLWVEGPPKGSRKTPHLLTGVESGLKWHTHTHTPAQAIEKSSFCLQSPQLATSEQNLFPSKPFHLECQLPNFSK